MNKKIITVDYSVQVINCIYKYGVFFLLTAKDHLSFNKALKNAYRKIRCYVIQNTMATDLRPHFRHGTTTKQKKQKKTKQQQKSISYSNSFVQMHFIVIYFNYRTS